MSVTITPFFSPKSISGCRMWLDADDPTGTGVLPSNGATVSTWVDKSGNGFNATAVVGTGQGSVPLTATATISSRGVLFSGNQTFSTTLNSMMNLQSIFIIMSVNSTNYIDTVSTSSPSSDSGLQIITSSLSQVVTRFGGTIVTGSSVAQNTIFMNEIFFTGGGTTTLYLNGTQSGTANNSPTLVNAGTVAIGAYQDAGGWAELFIGKIFEVIIYNVVLGSTDRQKVEAYLAQKWGLTSSLPSGHPGLTTISYRSSIPTPIKVTAYSSASFAFAPTQITGCQLWLDGADSTTTTSITSGIWTDKSGNGSNTSYVSGGSGLTLGNINGVSAVTFPGGANKAINASVSTSTTTGFSIFFIASRSSSAGADARYITNTSSTLQIYTISPNTISTYVNASFATSSLTISTSVPFIFSLTVSSSSFYQWINGTANSSSGSTGSASGSTIVIGASGTSYASNFVFGGQMGEVIIYNTALSTDQCMKVEAYLAQKWGIQSSLAVAHPGLTTTYYINQSFLSRASRTVPLPASVNSFITGGASSANGIYTVLTFSYPGGTLVVNKSISATILVIGGGGGGGGAGVQTGGGGAGGAVYVSSPVTISSGSYTVTVGQGGAASTSGGNSTFLSYTGSGGGRGGNWINGAGVSGGCGGGGSGEGGAGASGTQGFGGGSGRSQNTCGGGGGGMGSIGGTPNGGNGLAYSITGTSIVYAGGGGGNGGGGLGGTGGGGNATANGTNGLGGGGGGGGGTGGHGIVIISYVFV